MSCACNSTPCLCIPACDTACSEIIDYTFVNENLTGIGVLDGVVAQEVQFRGIASANSNLSVSLDGGNNAVVITLLDATLKGTATFVNDAARAAAVPAFNGQIGAQLDTDIAYVSSGIAAGNWVRLLREGTNTFTTGQSLTLTQAGTGTLTFNSDGITPMTFNASSGGLYFTTLGAGKITMTIAGVGGGLLVNGSETATFTNLGGIVANAPVKVTSGAGVLDIDAAGGAVVKISSALVPADSVLITTGVAGTPSSALRTSFLSSFATEAWVTPSGSLSRATFDTTTVTTQQLAERMFALLVDLDQLKKPTF